MSLPETYKVILSDENGQPIIKERPLPKPSANQVLVKISYAPINPADLFKLQGAYSAPGEEKSDLNGSEGSGTIVAVGENLNVEHKIGDRVHVAFGSWGQYLLTGSENVSKILQDDLSMEKAALHWVNPGAAYLMALHVEKGNHKAAIHTVASSQLGRMLIRYFKYKGIKLINIVRKDKYIEELKREGADYVLNSEWENFEEKLKEIATKENATIAFDAIGGTFTNKVLKCQPEGSTCLIYGALGGLELNGVSIMELLHDKSIGSSHLFGYFHQLTKKNGLVKFWKEIHEHLPDMFTTNIHKVFDFEDIKEALEYNEKNASQGKIMLKFD